MVKLFFLLSLLFTLNASAENLLHDKIHSYIGDMKYAKNKNFIDIIFEKESDFYIKTKVNVVKVLQTLKENGLLELFYNKPKMLKISFKTNANPLFFVKIMSDTLRGMGYYRYITEHSSLDISEFTWSIKLESEYAMDPILLRNQLRKRGCDIDDILRFNSTSWQYDIDMRDAHLDLSRVRDSEILEFNRSLYPHWIDVSQVKKIKIWALSGSTWYPYVAFYDKSMHLLKVYTRDDRTYQITLKLPVDTAYVKITDMYTLKNIKGGVRIKALGKR